MSIIAYFHADLKLMKHFSFRKELLEMFQKVTLWHIPNHCLKKAIYLSTRHIPYGILKFYTKLVNDNLSNYF